MNFQFERKRSEKECSSSVYVENVGTNQCTFTRQLHFHFVQFSSIQNAAHNETNRQKKRKRANNSLQAILLNIVSFGFRYTHFLFFFFCSSLTKHSSQLKFIFHNENLFLPQVYNYSNENVWQIESICRPVSEWQESRRKENTKKNVLAKENVTEKNK